MLYTSQTQSLSILEVLVHTSSSFIPKNLSILELEIKNNSSIKRLDPKTLPKNWKDYPAPFILSEIGTEWIKSNKTLLLKVPSAIAESDNNILINPNHPEFKNINVISIKPFRFDKRLFK